MTDTNVSSLVLKKGSNRYIFDPSGNLDLSNYYTKSEADGKYALKTDLNKYALTTHTHSNYATTTAVTNAQNTANNALKVANSKSMIDINKSFTEIRPDISVRSYIPTSNCFVISIGYNHNYSQRGITIGTLNDSAIGLLAANSPVTSDQAMYLFAYNF